MKKFMTQVFNTLCLGITVLGMISLICIIAYVLKQYA